MTVVVYVQQKGGSAPTLPFQVYHICMSLHKRLMSILAITSAYLCRFYSFHYEKPYKCSPRTFSEEAMDFSEGEVLTFERFVLIPSLRFPSQTFERRFQGMLRSAWQKRALHVIVADPGSGKTMGIRDLIRTTGSPSGTLSGRSYPVLAVTAKKTMKASKHRATICSRLWDCHGQAVGASASANSWGHRSSLGRSRLIIDDAHDLSLRHPSLEEVREILAALEMVYREPFPQLSATSAELWKGFTYP